MVKKMWNLHLVCSILWRETALMLDTLTVCEPNSSVQLQIVYVMLGNNSRGAQIDICPRLLDITWRCFLWNVETPSLPQTKNVTWPMWQLLGVWELILVPQAEVNDEFITAEILLGRVLFCLMNMQCSTYEGFDAIRSSSLDWYHSWCIQWSFIWRR